MRGLILYIVLGDKLESSMDTSVELEVRNFKSLVDVSVDITPVTVLIGPPASGKSNLLEALEALGYLLRVGVEVWSGVWDSVERVGMLTDYVRLTTCSDLVSRQTVSDRIDIVVRSDGYRVAVSMTCLSPLELKARVKIESEARLSYEVQALLTRETIQIPSSRLAGKEAEQLAFLVSMIESLARLSAARPPAKVTGVTAEAGVLAIPSPRLYSFDRMNVLRVVQGAVSDRYPLYLEEHGRNLGWLLYSNTALYEEVSAVVKNLSDLELRVLSDGRLVFFDGLRDVSASTVSETVLRVVYSLVGLATGEKLRRGIEIPHNIHAVPMKGKMPEEARLEPIVALEEPEAHVYPIAYNYLVDLVKRTSKQTPVIVATHSWSLAQLLLEKAKATIYYTMRTSGGTRIYRVDAEKAIEENVDLEELIYAGTARVDELTRRGVLVAA